MTITLKHPPLKSRPDLPGPFRISREQYHRLGELGFFENRRVELIRGEIIEMSPISWGHNFSKNKVAGLLEDAFEGIGWVNEQAPLVTDDSEPKPDVAVYIDSMDDYKEHPTADKTLVVVEVALTSLQRDTGSKARFYAEEGITDYWVLDVENRQLWAFRDPVEGEFRTQFKLAEADTITPLAAPEAKLSISKMLP